MKPVEIERKFLLASVPKEGILDTYEMYQGYLTSGATEVRIREKVYSNDKHTYALTVKGPGNLVREETNLNIDAECYYALASNIPQCFIRKRSYVYNVQGHQMLVAVVDEDSDTKFIYAEIEFETVHAAKAFDPSNIPGFLEDVTDRPEYKMKNYWNRTRLNKE